MSAAPVSPAAIRIDLGAIFVSLELSKSICLLTSLSPGSEKMSRHLVPSGDLPALLTCLEGLRDKAQAREAVRYPVIVIQEAGLDGFWIHRALASEGGITSHVVDAASIAVSRRHRGRRRTGSMARRWSARSWRGSVVSHGSARCCSRRRSRKRIVVGSGASAPL